MFYLDFNVNVAVQQQFPNLSRFPPKLRQQL